MLPTKRNIEEWIKEAADSSNPKKQFYALGHLGYYYWKNPSPKENPIKYFAQAALIDAWQIGGLDRVITCLEEGMTLPKELAEALEQKVKVPLLKQATDSSDSKKQYEALCSLGYYHLKGLFLPKGEAINFFGKAVVINDHDISFLGPCLEQDMKFSKEVAEMLQGRAQEWRKRIQDVKDRRSEISQNEMQVDKNDVENLFESILVAIDNAINAMDEVRSTTKRKPSM